MSNVLNRLRAAATLGNPFAKLTQTWNPTDLPNESLFNGDSNEKTAKRYCRLLREINNIISPLSDERSGNEELSDRDLNQLYQKYQQIHAILRERHNWAIVYKAADEAAKISPQAKNQEIAKVESIRSQLKNIYNTLDLKGKINKDHFPLSGEGASLLHPGIFLENLGIRHRHTVAGVPEFTNWSLRPGKVYHSPERQCTTITYRNPVGYPYEAGVLEPEILLDTNGDPITLSAGTIMELAKKEGFKVTDYGDYIEVDTGNSQNMARWKEILKRENAEQNNQLIDEAPETGNGNGRPLPNSGSGL
jgi:hypothetical protein